MAAMPEPEASTGYSRRELLTRYWQTPISRGQYKNGTFSQPEQYLQLSWMPSGHSLWSNLTPLQQIDSVYSFKLLKFETLCATTTPTCSLVELITLLKSLAQYLEEEKIHR